MKKEIQQYIAFYLTGRVPADSDLQQLDGHCRPALLARYGDLSTLRYDLPLILNREGEPERALLSLIRLVDDAVGVLEEDPDRDRIARHGYRLERRLRQELARGNSPGEDFAALWNKAAAGLAGEDESVLDSAGRLWTGFGAAGELVDADSALPSRVIRHCWNAVQTRKARVFRQKTERLLLKLRGILTAEMVGSAAGRKPERLRSGFGSLFADKFDFEEMSRILTGAKPDAELSDERRKRISGVIKVLGDQRFYSLGTGGPEPYTFAFDRCSDALRAYRERHAEALELARALAIAKLEVDGEYRESVHNVLFEDFGANGLDADQLAELPDYLVCTDGQALSSAETAQMIELLAAGLPVKILVRTDDVLEPSVVAEGHVALGLRARQLVDTAIGLTDVFVFQSGASQVFRMRDSLLRGLTYDGPALFSVFSGAGEHTGDLPAYLVAAAAVESRAFPALVYDPSRGADWATRLTVEDNPLPMDDWPVHTFAYEDGEMQSRSEELPFTLADFMAMDDRFFPYYAIFPENGLKDALIPVPEALESKPGKIGKAPCIALINEEGGYRRAILTDRILREVRRCHTMWHSLQELGGIHNSHAERLLAQERGSGPAEDTAPPQPAVTTEKPPATESAATAEVTVSEPVAAERNGDDPYIETIRCTSCNECTRINSKMFSYNENQQAYIADPDAGTFRQLVEAAESCQVAIIHPGKPRNPQEPGLEDLIRRAAEFT
jgi:hypothetical protein